MDRKSIAILLIASSFASSAFATSIVNKLIANHKSAATSITKTHKTTKQTNGSYIDFTGTWTGDCANGQNLTTVIENDADYISFDGDRASIGKGLQGTYHSNDEETAYFHASLEWNKDGSALVIQGVDVNKDNKDNSAIETMLSTFNLTMKNGQINLDGKLTGFEDTQKPYIVHCVLSRKQ
jgi:hypothetical protein